MSFRSLVILAIVSTLVHSQYAFLPDLKGIGQYETLNYARGRQANRRVRRSTGPEEFPLTAFGRNYTLLLWPDRDLFTHNAVVSAGGEERPAGSLSGVVKGTIRNFDDSIVFGSVMDGLFRGNLYPLGLTKPGLVIEPSGVHFPIAMPFHSIVYREDNPHIKKQLDPGHFCGLSHSDVQQNMRYMAQTMPYHQRYTLPRTSQPKAEDESSVRVCNLFLRSDTFLWDHVMNMPHVRNNEELAIKEITSIFTSHVQSAQSIFQRAIFRDFTGQIEYRGVTFRVDRVQINITHIDCKRRSRHNLTSNNLPMDRPASASAQQIKSRGAYEDENPFCEPNIDVSNFLNLNSYESHDGFCLAYVFTYRDFTSGTLGLAWVAQPEGSGGICEKFRSMRGGQNGLKQFNRSLNTGVVTLMNYNTQVALKVSQLTFTHEIGHNFGAKHDDDHRLEHPECLPSVDDPRGNYIMFASATSGDKSNNNQFSSCSLDSIARLMQTIYARGNHTKCFLASDGPFCGNRLVERNEQCDCGFTKDDCQDQCCFPNDSPKPCQLRDMVNNKRVRCSPTAGICCNHDCSFRAKRELCQAAGECHEASHCTGSSHSCPDTKPFPDGTPCQNHTRVCKSGQCIGSICERVPGWSECSDISLEKMCYVSCRPNQTIALKMSSLLSAELVSSVNLTAAANLQSPCVSTFDLERDERLQRNFPQMVSEFLRNGKGIQFRPGQPCDNYRGYCDAFLKCRPYEAQGPLARIRNMLFSPQVLRQVQDWITEHWWAIIFFCVASIIGMVIFAKFCGYSHPSARPPPRLLRGESFAPPVYRGVGPSRRLVVIPGQAATAATSRSSILVATRGRGSGPVFGSGVSSRRVHATRRGDEILLATHTPATDASSSLVIRAPLASEIVLVQRPGQASRNARRGSRRPQSQYYTKPPGDTGSAPPAYSEI